MNSIYRLSISLKNYTFLLLITALLGVHIISINLGFIQLSPYRILLILSPFVFLKVKKRTIMQLMQSKNYEYFALMLFWVLYSFIPIVWIKDFSAWIKLFIFLVSGFITTWYIGLYFTQKEDIIKALKIIEVLSVFFGGIALYEILTGNYLFLDEINLAYFQERSQLDSTIGFRVPISVFGNPNNYSLFLLFTVFSSLGLSKTKKTKIGRFFSLCLTLFFIFLLIATQSRSGFIGLVLSFVAYGLETLRRTKVKTLWKLALVISLAIVYAIPWIIQNKELFEALISINLNASSGSESIRINLIKNGLRFLYRTFFLGVGLGNIEYHMVHYSIFSTEGIINIHNWWIEILVSSGIFVFMFYIIVYLKNLKRLFKFSLHCFDLEAQQLSVTFYCFLIGFLIASMGASSLMHSEWLWPIMAIIMSFINLNHTRISKS